MAKKSSKKGKNQKASQKTTSQNYEYAGESDPLVLYLRQISKYPLLTIQQEQEIGQKIQTLKAELENIEMDWEMGMTVESEYKQRKNDTQEYLRITKNRMINANLRLVVSIAKKYQHRGLSLLDLIDEGNIGLIEAVERFDYKKGCRFSTYGTWWIRQAIIKSLADKGRVIRIPIHMLNTIKKCYFVAKHLTQELGRDPKPEELADYMELPVSKIKEITKLSQETASLDTTVDNDNATRLSDLIEDEHSSKPFDFVFNLTIQDTLEDVLNKLSEREMRIIQMRYGLGGEAPLTLEETGKVLGITRERVRQIQEKAIIKLKSFRHIQELEDAL
ncbi:MAG: RNA polymerase sigma factor RpoD/SigA [Spirochaetia bacterium]